MWGRRVLFSFIMLKTCFASDWPALRVSPILSFSASPDNAAYERCKACIKKVKFSSESLKSEVEELCEQLKDSALTDLSNDNIRITCHQNNNNSINKNQNNNSIDINIGKMSETNESNDTAAQSAEGERPSFLV